MTMYTRLLFEPDDWDWPKEFPELPWVPVREVKPLGNPEETDEMVTCFWMVCLIPKTSVYDIWTSSPVPPNPENVRFINVFRPLKFPSGGDPVPDISDGGPCVLNDGVCEDIFCVVEEIWNVARV